MRDLPHSLLNESITFSSNSFMVFFFEHVKLCCGFYFYISKKQLGECDFEFPYSL